jgi:carbon-monoxide dehydrogenase large subunit
VTPGDDAPDSPVFSAINGRWVGARLPRREDPRLLTGRGCFVDDLARARVGLRRAAFVRAPVAAARITHVDLSGLPTGAEGFDAAALGVQDLVAVLDRTEFVPTAIPVLAKDRVRHVGEPVAIVLAEDAYAAEDAAEAVVVDYEPGNAVADLDAALAPDAPRVHPDAGGNGEGNVVLDVRPFDDAAFDTGGAEDVFASAAHVVTVSVRSARVSALPLEGRACLAEWNATDDQLVVHISTQVPHQVRTAIARSLGLPERQVRVVVPDVGGGFGLKCVVGREEVAVAASALRTGRPVAWTEDRQENLTASFHGHEQAYQLRGAVAEDGTLLGLDADIRCDVGAYSVFPFTYGVEPLMAAHELPGVYRVPRYRVRARAVATHKPPTAPYRGVSRPQIVLAMEQLMERIARTLGVDALEVRRRNLITEFPWAGVNEITYDAGSYRESLDRCEALLREEGWYERRERGSAEGRHLGIGFACFNERTGYGSGAFAARKMDVVPGYDICEARMDASGTVLVTSGTCGHGQSHETTLAQIAADQLGLHPDQIRVRQGDTDLVPYGWGTFASRSAVVGGAAVRVASDRLAEKVRRIAAHLLEAPAEDVEITDGHARVRGTEAGMPVAEVARVALLQSHRLPEGMEPGLAARASFDVDGPGTFSNATHGVVCELDAGTGAVRVLRYVVVEDCGVVINPQVVDGQVRGGVAQGLAAALYEALRYDEAGTPLTGTLMDYLVPTATEVPVIDIEHLETPCAFSVTGAKGMGEGGTIGAPAAVLGAVNDALRHTGVELDAIPIRPEAVLAALHGRSGQHRHQEPERAHIEPTAREHRSPRSGRGADRARRRAI